MLDVFANRHTCITSRIYPTHAGSDHLGLFATGGTVKVEALDIWELEEIWG